MIRLITEDDAAATLEIYRPYVENNVISFEGETPTLDEWKAKIKNILAEYAWLVYEHEGEIVGYAYASRHRYRTAYNWSAESTIYMKEGFHRKGVGKILYKKLFEVLKLQGYVNVYAGVTMPNEKSEQFHLAVGFYEVGYFRKIGYKLGGWHDTRWFQLHLTDHQKKPVELRSINELKDTVEFKKIFDF
ncbi:MAG TPA: GNAT family N-acetyltransferase [Chitinophagaceae bacterium]|nr:GNAT family N-acetyltransferase [Chitinophagaceae bacterium]